MKEIIKFTLNGEPVQLTTDGDRKLLWVLRTNLRLTGAKYGCGKGLCGSCTVLLDRRAVPSCRLPVKLAKGKEITTIEGLAKNGQLHPLQKAFVDHNAIQCGFCTPGMIITAVALLDEHANPTDEEIRCFLQGNLCRCTGYHKIVQAIQAAAKESTQ